METLKSAIKPVFEKTVEMMTELNSELCEIRDSIIAEKLSSLTLSSVVRHIHNMLCYAVHIRPDVLIQRKTWFCLLSVTY